MCLNRSVTQQQPVTDYRPASRANQKAEMKMVHQCMPLLLKCMYICEKSIYLSVHGTSAVYTSTEPSNLALGCIYVCVHGIYMSIHLITWTHTYMYIFVYMCIYTYIQCTYYTYLHLHVCTVYIRVCTFQDMYIVLVCTFPVLYISRCTWAGTSTYYSIWHLKMYTVHMHIYTFMACCPDSRWLCSCM